MKYLSLILLLAASGCSCMLQPRESETRDIKDLSGMWSFRADYSSNRNEGFEERWFETSLRKTGDVIAMPVPASYNDITTDAELRDFIGWAWYETEFYVSKDWFSNKRIFLRFGSAHYNTVVWVNSKEVMTHSGGHLPFECDISAVLSNGQLNRLTVAVNNTLTPTTLPPGIITYYNDSNRYPAGYFTQGTEFDFFNYAGIHRRVLLYTTPTQYIADVSVKTQINGTAGVVYYEATVESSAAGLRADVIDADGQYVQYEKGLQGTIVLPDVHLWYPFTMSKDPAYLYTLQLILISTESGETIDVYRQPFGVRTITFTNSSLLINNQPFYCRGIGRHEDSDIRGKGVDLPLIARDYNLIKWLGANCFRTSHYPYAEEIMDEADKQGIVVIDESPGVGIKSSNYGNASLLHHKTVMIELVARDKNRPSVIMWSVANEPSSSDPAADHYFKEVIATTRQADNTRPVTFVIGPSDYWKDQAAKYVDILCINRYYSWYSDMGHIEVVGYQLSYDLNMWHKTFNKPIIMSEYGAGSATDFTSLPSTSFTTDYQIDFLKAYHPVFDALRKTYLVGEMVWNFADFMTAQAKSRMYGNRKGLFTRQRQPKPAAHTIRERYHTIINQ